jgi:hypothetical protein
MVPLRLVRPMVGRSPTQAQCDAGPRVLSPVSVPSAACANPVATAAALPPLDPVQHMLLTDNLLLHQNIFGCCALSCTYAEVSRKVGTCYSSGGVIGISHDAEERPP